jgi:serine/threonine-protein kinase
LSAPAQIGKYKIVDVVGTGGMGTVYRAFDPSLERVVALKILHLDRLDDVSSEELKSRFVDEARTVARLNHPGIVAVYEFAQDGQLAYISMEYVDGWTLDTYVKNRDSLDTGSAVTVMMQVLEALSYAHRQAVVHRDIKPANLLVGSEGQVKITDFGIAKIGARNRTQTGILVGTMEYMAPEQFLGGRLDHRCDIHAAGVVMYELLAGVSPFRHGGGFAMYKVCHEVPQPPSSIKPSAPRIFDSVVARALAKRPEDRYPTAKDFRNAIWAAYHAISGREPDATLATSASSENSSTSIKTRARDKAPDDGVPESGGTAPNRERPPAVPPPVRVEPIKSVAAPTAPPAVSPLTTGGSAPSHMAGIAWPAGQLADLERQLVPLVGPLARVLVRKAAAIAHDRHELVGMLADGLQANERARFLQAVGDAHGFLAADTIPPRSTGNPSVTAPGSTNARLRATGPLTDERAQFAARILAQYVGPIATVLSRKAAQNARDEGEYLELLAANLKSETERLRFMREATGHRA